MLTTTVQAADSRRDLLIHDIRTPLATISKLRRKSSACGTPPAWNAPSPISSTTRSNTTATIARWW